MKVVPERVAPNPRIGLISPKTVENLRKVALRQVHCANQAAIDAIIQAKLAQRSENQ